MSEADLPIKSAVDIQHFFEENNGKEFIHFGTEQYQQDIQQRYNVFHFFTKHIGRKREKIWVDIETYSLAIQRRLHIDRTKKLKFSFYGGSNWCSITKEFASYVVKHFRKYKKAFYFSQISDEAIWQTIVMDSPYSKNLYGGGFENNYDFCMRYIDWERGNPYVFREDDYNDLMNSKCMFARKFDENMDEKIIKMIYNKLIKEDSPFRSSTGDEILNDLQISREQIAQGKCKEMGQAIMEIRDKYGLWDKWR